jgi:hypothetical protein
MDSVGSATADLTFSGGLDIQRRSAVTTDERIAEGATTLMMDVLALLQSIRA